MIWRYLWPRTRIGNTAFALAVVLAPPQAVAGTENENVSPSQVVLTAIGFDDFVGWQTDDHAAALRAFQRGCKDGGTAPETRSLGIDGATLHRICRKAHQLAADVNPLTARRFFEAHFVPHRFPNGINGYLTGYFEPELDGSRTSGGRFQVPLFRRPGDLIKVTGENRPDHLDPSLEFARQTKYGLAEHPDRADITAGALADRDLELVFIENPVDAFFVHIQGSARIRLTDGTTIRLGFDGKSGHPYTSIAAILIDGGIIDREAMTMTTLRAWLEANPDDARGLMVKNRSFIFFREATELNPDFGPKGAAGVQLTPGRSLAVDRKRHTYGTPIWIEADLPVDTANPPQPVGKLMIAQDTGSAITGPARGDVFIGSGDDAGTTAGRIRHAASMTIFVPRPASAGTSGQ